MMKMFKFSIFFFIAIFQSASQAAIGAIGADIDLYTYACRLTYTGDCRSARHPDFPALDEGEQLNYPSNVLQSFSNQYASASASAQFDSYSSLLPILRAKASAGGYQPTLSNPNPAIFTGQTAVMADANVWAVGHYRYFGSTPTWISITAKGDTSFYSPLGEPVNGHSYMQIAAYDNDNYNFNIDGGCFISSGCANNSIPVTVVRAFLDPTVSFNLLTIHYFVQPGDDFYVGAKLDANVCCLASVDTSHTMTMEFGDASMLEMLPIPGLVVPSIPEPKFVYLLLSGFIILNILSSKLLKGRRLNMEL